MTKSIINKLVNSTVSVQDIASICRVTKRTVYNWIDEIPDFPHPVIHRNRTRRWDLNEIQEWLKGGPSSYQ